MTRRRRQRLKSCHPGASTHLKRASTLIVAVAEEGPEEEEEEGAEEEEQEEGQEQDRVTHSVLMRNIWETLLTLTV